jgi:transmembrane sensor
MENRVQYLLDRFKENQLTAVEKTELLVLSDRFPELLQYEIMEELLQHKAVQEEPDHRRWQSLLERVLDADRVPVIHKAVSYQLLKWSVAAAILLATAFSFYFVNQPQDHHEIIADVVPGGKKAILTLADGKKIALSDIKNGSVIRQNGIKIAKTADGHLVYTDENPAAGTAAGQYNTISTPKGGEWELRLADGSTVWLNSASSLTYPSNIATASLRKVTLQGEAYFEVAKNKVHPFIVESRQQSLEVLGTHFNVNSYPDEEITRTTLLEGSVKIAGILHPGSAILKPGQQAVMNTSAITVSQVNPDESIAWKNGYFMFNNERQESIMRKIARWYNVEVEYADPAAKEVMYYGTVSRFEKISKVLRKFEQTGEVRFEIKANKVTVYKE